MKSTIKFLVLVTGLITILAACNKVADLPYYDNGIAPVLTASAATVAPAAADSNKVALTLDWTYPKYATDTNNIKYTIDIDSTGKNFSKATSKVVMGSMSTSFTAKELNTMLLNYGYAFNVPVDMDVRVTSSYANNNERIGSNILKIRMTPYKVPPKVALPTTGKLFLVGDASQSGWDNPVKVPEQEFSRIDETTFAGVFQLNGGKQFLLLPQNGDWTHKFAVPDNTVAGLSAGGVFGFDAKDNFPAPATSGWYKIVVDFQVGRFTVTPFTGVLPTNLFIVGDATAGGWNNPVPATTQQFRRLNSSEFELTLPLNGGKEFLLLPVNGSWDHKYAVKDKSLAGLSNGGDLGYDLGDNLPAPTANGTYKINVNFALGTTGKFTVTKQ